MNPIRKSLILHLTEGQPKLLPFVYELTQYRRCDEVLRWLRDHRIVGKHLTEYLESVWHCRILSMVQFILMKIDKDKETTPVLFGRDYQTRPYDN